MGAEDVVALRGMVVDHTGVVHADRPQQRGTIGYIVLYLIRRLFPFAGGKRHIGRILDLATVLYIGTNVVRCAGSQTSKGDGHILRRASHLHVVDGGIGRCGITHPPARNGRALSSSLHNGRRRSNVGHHGRRYRQRG